MIPASCMASKKTFEAALGRLEQITEELEQGDVVHKLFEEVGEKFGVTREKVRQISNLFSLRHF